MNTQAHALYAKPILQNPLWWISHLMLGFTLIVWFNPITHGYCQALDIWIFKILNGSLVNSPFWQQFWGILNHRKESLLNLIMAACFNLWVILRTQDKMQRKILIRHTLYFWVCFQIGYMLQDYFFNTYLKVERDSPSLVVSPVLRLAEVLQNPKIKDFSTHSFPGGHAFAMVYWGSFTWLITPKRWRIFGLFMAILLSLSRLFSGAHWFSDVFFSSLLALIWLSWNQAFRNNFKHIF